MEESIWIKAKIVAKKDLKHTATIARILANERTAAEPRRTTDNKKER